MASRAASGTIRVVVVDDHPLLREGLATVLASDPVFELVGVVEGAGGALSTIATLEPDVAVIDLNLPDGDGADLCAHVQAEHPRVRPLVFTRSTGPHFVMRAFRSGARGYAVKSADPGQILHAIRTVASGDSYIDPLVAAYVVDTAIVSKPASRESYGLTRQERNVVELAAAKLKNRQIALEMGLSIETVKTHLRHAMKKMGVDDRHAAAQILKEKRDEGRSRHEA